MVKPMRATPILFGKAARRFERRMKHVRKATLEEKERGMRAYEAYLAGEEYERKRRGESDENI